MKKLTLLIWLCLATAANAAWTERYVRADAAGSGDGTTDTNSGGNGAWTLAEAISNANAGHRINVKAGTYANTTTSRAFGAGAGAGTTTSPKWWRGFKTTIGDLDSEVSRINGTAGTDFPLITFTSGAATVTSPHQWFTNIEFRASAPGTVLVTTSQSKIKFHRCRFDNQEANSTSYAFRANSGSDGVQCSLCWFKVTSTATSCVVNDERTIWFGCSFHGGGTANTNGQLMLGDQACTVAYCIFDNSGGNAIHIQGSLSTPVAIINNSIYSPAHDGIRLGSAVSANLIIANNIFEDCLYGINNATGTNTNVPNRVGNAFYNMTSGQENGFGDAPAFGATSLGASAFTNAAGGDFTLASTAKALGLPGLFENEAFSGFLDPGAVQREEPTGGGGTVYVPGPTFFSVFHSLPVWLIAGLSAWAIRKRRQHLAKFLAIVLCFAACTAHAADIVVTGYTDVAIQNALDKAEKNRLSEPSKGIGYVGAQQAVYLPCRRYKLNKPLRVSHYTRIVGDGAVIEPSDKFPAGRYAIEGLLWQGEIRGLHFNGINGINIWNNNLDQGSIRITDCKAHGGDEFLRLDCRSTRTQIDRITIDNTKKVATIVSGDLVDFQNIWLTAPEFDTDEQCSIEICEHESPQTVTFSNVHAFPGATKAKRIAWIANRGGIVKAHHCRWSGENGGRTVVNNYKQADCTYPVVPLGVELTSCEVYAADQPAIRLFAVPNFLAIEKCRGFVASRAIAFAEGVDPKAAIEAGEGKEGKGKCKVTERDNTKPEAYKDFVPAELEAKRE